MSRRLIVEPGTEADIGNGYDWYQERQIGLGLKFIEEVDVAFNRIVENPVSYQEVALGIRRAVVHTYPYLVFFTFDSEAVYILAVLPAAQDPAYINARLEAES